MAGLRLSIAGGMSRYSPLDPIPPSARSITPPVTNSASLTAAQRRIKVLQYVQILNFLISPGSRDDAMSIL